MERLPISAREDWQKRVEEFGLFFHTHQGKPYWFEEAFYKFDSNEVGVLESATNDLANMCLEAVQHVIDKNRFAELRIPEKAVPAILQSWDDDPPSLYGRFDLAYDGGHPPKLFEYNADTPTSLLEAAVIQWKWFEDVFESGDQFNSIWEGLVEKWKELLGERAIKGHYVHFAHEAHMEDLMTVSVLRDTAEEAGLMTKALLMKDIGWESHGQYFVDLEDSRMWTIFKLYPWEWMVHDKFGEFALKNYNNTQWIEPIWKMILSNKGILAILWEMYPGHPNLLPTYIGRSHDLENYVRKPLLSREGANVLLKVDGVFTKTEGQYGEEGYVYQQYCALPDFDGNHPVIGSWVIDHASHGIGIRESDGPVTDDFARFVPHVFEG